MRFDAVVVTVASTFPLGLTVTATSSSTIGHVDLRICNVTEAEIDAGPTNFHWIAFRGFG